jgi:hypothetical protein
LGTAGIPEKLTAPGLRLLEDYQMVVDLIAFVATVTVHSDEAARIAARALLPDAKNEEERARYERTLKEGRGARKSLVRFRRLMTEMVLCRNTDNFLTYISQLLALVFRTRPETLRSKGTEKLDFILQYTSMDDLVAAIAEKRVNDLSYKGIDDLAEYLQDQIGFVLFDSSENSDRAKYLIEVRNLLVHNRGIVNQIFLSRLRSYSRHELGNLGEPVSLDSDFIFDAAEMLIKSAFDIDARAAAKWNLPVQEPVPTGDSRG